MRSNSRTNPLPLLLKKKKKDKKKEENILKGDYSY